MITCPTKRLSCALLALAALLGVGASASAQGLSTESSAEEGTVLLFVPELDGEVVTGIGVQSRLTLSDDVLQIPGTVAQGILGYRHYFDPEGRFGLGGYVGASTTLPLEGQVATGPFLGVSGGLSFQYRAMTPDFIYVPIAAFVEAGTIIAPDEDPTSTAPTGVVPPGATGFRLLFGVEAGFGFLAFLDPYIFGESGVRFGLEFLDLGGAKLTSITFGYQLRVDFVVR